MRLKVLIPVIITIVVATVAVIKLPRYVIDMRLARMAEAGESSAELAAKVPDGKNAGLIYERIFPMLQVSDAKDGINDVSKSFWPGKNPDERLGSRHPAY